MPLIGTVLASPLIGPASLFLAVYGSGTYADFWTLCLGSLFVSVGGVAVGAVLVAVPFDLGMIRRRTSTTDLVSPLAAPFGKGGLFHCAN